MGSHAGNPSPTQELVANAGSQVLSDSLNLELWGEGCSLEQRGVQVVCMCTEAEDHWTRGPIVCTGSQELLLFNNNSSLM